MNNKGLNLQDVFLNQARKDRLPLTIFLDERLSAARDHTGL